MHYAVFKYLRVHYCGGEFRDRIMWQVAREQSSLLLQPLILPLP